MAVAVENPKEFVVGADTVVVIDGKVLGKPKDKEDTKKNAEISFWKES